MATISHCPLCLTWSGRYNMNLECCQIRYLTQIPKNQRAMKYESVKKEQGKEAANRLITMVNQEMARMKKRQPSARASSVERAPQLF